MNRMNDDRSYAGLVQKYIGSAYDTVAQIAAAIEAGWLTPDNMQTVDNNHAFLDSSGLNLDRTKPYFTRGGYATLDGDAAYYIYLKDISRRAADGKMYIDPTTALDNQGANAGEGVWARQVAGSGDPGITGPQGEVGAQGPTGGDGAQGSAGVAGTPGTDGAIGSAGIPGDHGATGQTGVQGIQGEKGIQGGTGSQGIQGDQGGQGNKGDVGPQGPTGPRGADGTTGADGVAGTGVHVLGRANVADILLKSGAIGDMWISGNAGVDSYNHAVHAGDGLVRDDANKWAGVGQIQGPHGDAGATGPEGAIGGHGPAGQDGSTGPRGIQGEDGPEGPQGAHGPQGVEGNQGDPGRGIHVEGVVEHIAQLLNINNPREGEAHLVKETGDLWIWDTDLTRRVGNEIFHVTGYTATQLEDWHRIGHIQGPAGDAGQQGIQGPRGAQGLKGSTGVQGPVGPQGPKGVKGDSGLVGSISHNQLQNRNAAGAHATSAITGLDAKLLKITALETRMGGLTFKKLTKAQYTALASKNANTFYILVG